MQYSHRHSWSDAVVVPPAPEGTGGLCNSFSTSVSPPKLVPPGAGVSFKGVIDVPGEFAALDNALPATFVSPLVVDWPPPPPPHVIDGYLAHGLDIKEKDVRWDAHADPDLFLRRMKTRLYRPYRCWVPRVKIKLVHWKRALEAEQKELRSAGQAFRGPVDLA